MSDATTETRELQEAVRVMDTLSQEGFTAIITTAKLALHYMENPACYTHLETIADALVAIKMKAELIENLINSTAQDVGLNHKCDAWHRRWNAKCIAENTLKNTARPAN